VDGIPFLLPVASTDTSALMAAFSIDANRAAELLPGKEIHPLRLGRRGVLLVTVVDYRATSIGSYIEYSIAIACTHGLKPAWPFLPALFSGAYGVGQFVVDLPVSTEISVKGGKGIWGMPKHQASLDFKVTPERISSQYDLDGQLGTYIEIERPGRAWFPLSTGASNYCGFRGMLMKSTIYFQGKLAFGLFGNAKGRFVVGDHPRTRGLARLDIAPKPFFTGFLPKVVGTLDDHFECWFLSEDRAVDRAPEGFESVLQLGQGRDWPPAPIAPVPSAETGTPPT
jgi:hypothetical protein